jgi:hypothetical protein
MFQDRLLWPPQARAEASDFHALSYEWGHEDEVGTRIFIKCLLEPQPIRKKPLKLFIEYPV